MKHLGKQSRHLTVCPNLCQAWGQNGELMQHIITAKAQCQVTHTGGIVPTLLGPEEFTIRMG